MDLTNVLSEWNSFVYRGLTVLEKCKLKPTMRYHLTLVRIAIVKSLQIINAGEGVEKRKPSYTVLGM